MADNVIEFLLKGDASGAIKAFGDVDSAMSAVVKGLGALGVAFSAVELVKFVGDQIDVADQFNKMSEKTGVAVESLSALDRVFRLNDMSAQDMEQSFRFLNKSVDEAKTGNIAVQKSFESLGISMKEVRNSSPEEMFLKLADAYTQIEDPAARTTMLLDKFGRAGVQLAPAMAEGRAGIEKLMNQARELGLVVDKEFAVAANRFNDNVETIKQATEGSTRGIAKMLLPILNETIETIFDFGGTGTESIVPWGKIFVSVVGEVADALIGLKVTLASMVDAVATAFQATGTFIGSVAASVQQAMEGNFKGAVATLKDGWNDMGQTAQKSVDRINDRVFVAADGINKINDYVLNYGESVKKAGTETEKAGKYKLDPVSVAAAQRLEELRKKVEQFQSDAVKAAMAASGNRMGLLDAEYQRQVQVLNDLKAQGADTTKAQLALDQAYAAQKVAIQQDMLSKLGVGDAAYREQLLANAQRDADQMIRAGLGQAAADKYLNEQRLAIQQQFLDARNQLVSADYQTTAENADLQFQADQLRLQMALDQEFITRDQYNQMLTQAELSKQARLGSIQAQAELNRLNVTKMTTLQQLQYTSNALGSITGLMQSENKKQFEIGKAAAIAMAIMNTYTSAVNAYQSASAIPIIGWILGPIAAAAAIALGLQNVNKIRSTQFTGQAHDGMTSVPREGTYMLDKGERVLSPEQNQDLTSFMRAGAPGGAESSGAPVTIGSLTVEINIPNGEALIGMTRRDWEEVVSARIVPALNVLDRKGVRPDFVQRYAR